MSLPQVFLSQFMQRSAARAEAFSEVIKYQHPCPSPIEHLFLTAVLLLAEEYGHMAIGSLEKARTQMFWITLQEPILTYKADFVIGLTDFPDAQRIVVECDGHDFHERTKEQAMRDRRRDREMQSAGFKVFRFTGSEIHRDAFACAHEALQASLAIHYEALK